MTFPNEHVEKSTPSEPAVRPATRHAVIIASVRRPECLGETLESVARQEPLPELVVLAVVADSDLPAKRPPQLRLTIIAARPGSCQQRNDGLAALPPEMEYVTFLDDDVELTPDYLANVRGVFEKHSDIVLISGNLLRNGNIDRAGARQITQKAAQEAPDHTIWVTSNGYGCNLSVRRSVAEKVRFDERFRSYGWLEDADFSIRCVAFGTAVTYAGSRCVHLAINSGRVSGRRFGFAQIMNPYYLRKKGVLSRREMLRNHWIPAMLGNVARWITFDRAVDRWGRIRGNLTALRLIVCGRCEPEYVEKFKR